MTKQILPGYKQTKIGVIPEDWEVVKLDQVFQKSFYGTSDSTNEIGKYPVLRMGNMQNGTLDLKNLAYINLEEKEFKKYQLKKGDILLNRTNSYELVGKVSLFDLEGNYMSASYIVAYRPNFNILNPVFINNLLNTIFFQEKIKTIATKGVSQVNINPTSFKEIIKIPLPPIKEQEKMAEIFSTWDEAITKQTQLIEQKQGFKRGIMQQIFSQKLRFKNKDCNNYPMWQSKKLGLLCKLAKSGGTPTSTNQEYYNGSIPFLAISDITSQGKYLTHTTKRISQKGIECSSSWVIPVDSIIYSMYASVGNVSINKIPLATSQAVINLVLKENVNVEFIYYYLSDYKKCIHKYIETGTQGNLNAGIVKSINVNLPILEEQIKVANFLTSIDDEITKQIEILDQLKLQKQALMQRLLTGQVRV